MGGIFGLGGAGSKTDRNHQLGAWGTLGDVSESSAKGGTAAVGQAQNYWSSLLSGDQSKIGQAIAPQTKIIQGQAQQQKNQLSEFGNRSGGTNAGSQMIDTNSFSKIQDIINTLIPQAASQLGQLGMGQLGIATNAAGELGNQTETAREFDKKQENALGAGIGSLLKAGLTMIPGIGGYASTLFNGGKKPA